MSLRSSAEILGLPTRLPDRERQYEWNPARCQRMIVSGRRIAMAPRMEGNQQPSQTNRKRWIVIQPVCGEVQIRYPRTDEITTEGCHDRRPDIDGSDGHGGSYGHGHFGP